MPYCLVFSHSFAPISLSSSFFQVNTFGARSSGVSGCNLFNRRSDYLRIAFNSAAQNFSKSPKYVGVSCYYIIIQYNSNKSQTIGIYPVVCCKVGLDV